jgi:nicotinate dehydrogenase subunit A
MVNGQPVAADVPADTPLLWVLRDDLGLCAAKFGCGLEQCGACQVLIDDVPGPSCRVPLGDLEGRCVTTLEQLAGEPDGQRVVSALLGRNAGQCGYCLPGIVVTLVHLLRRRDAVAWADVIRALDAHLCRCGSQPRIIAAAAELLFARDGARNG